MWGLPSTPRAAPMTKARTQMTCERIDDDEVVVRLVNLGLDADGDRIEDIEIRLTFYEDTDRLEVAIETRADSTIAAELRRSSDITLRFEDVPNPFGPEAKQCEKCCAICEVCCNCGIPEPSKERKK